MMPGPSRFKAFQAWLHGGHSSRWTEAGFGSRGKTSSQFGIGRTYPAGTTGLTAFLRVTYGKKGNGITFAAPRHIRWI